MGRLSGKIALITGTGGGQGRAAAILFAREGAKVVGCDINEKGAQETLEMVRQQGGDMISMAPVDLSDETAARAWVEQAVRACGGVDIVYNNAGAARPGPLAALSTAAWRYTLANELDLIFYVTNAAWPHLVKRGGGSIINTASIIGWRTSDLPMAARGASKNAVIGLTVHMAVEGGPDGIRANCISPGLIDAPTVGTLLKDPFDAIQKQVRTSPLGRVGRPEDVAPLALFLASDESAYITGVNIVVDGGQTLGIGMSFGRDDPAHMEARSAETSDDGDRIEIRTPDGVADAYLFRPRTSQTANPLRPGVLMYTDIMGVRPVFKAMAQRLADAGFVVLLPNLFYRSGPPADPPLSVHRSGEFAKLMALMPTLTREAIQRDAGAYLAALTDQPDVQQGPVGCVGYCMSGGMAVWTVSAYPDRVGAVAAFHGGHLATGGPDSPARLAAASGAAFYFGLAETDAFMTPEMIERLRSTLDEAGARYQAEVYPGTFHGFTIPDAGYNQTGAELHWVRMIEFFKDILAPKGPTP